MSSEQIKANLQELRQRLKDAGPPDAELQELLTQLDQDLHRMLETEAGSGGEAEGLQERLESMAADFDSRHPQLAAVLREVGVALARVGI